MEVLMLKLNADSNVFYRLNKIAVYASSFLHYFSLHGGKYFQRQIFFFLIEIHPKPDIRRRHNLQSKELIRDSLF